MSDQPYNEPAFPIVGGLHEHQFIGMTLRDYFAAKALQSGWLRNTDSGWNPSSGMLNAETIAFACYEIADAMLKARQS